MRTSSPFSAPPATATTWAPAAVPSWITAVPTADAPPITSSSSPACNFARRCTARYPVWNGSVNAAACTSSNSGGASNTPFTPASA